MAKRRASGEGLLHRRGKRWVARIVIGHAKDGKPGTGCITEINDHLFEGRYSPMWVDGKKRGFNVYAKTREEVEVKLAELIVQVKAEKKRLLAEIAAQEGGKTRKKK